MSHHCAHCGSAQTNGPEAASVCTECATATVAGIPISLTLVLSAVLMVSVSVVAFRMLHHRTGKRIPITLPALRSLNQRNALQTKV